jgi:hypothetical protein
MGLVRALQERLGPPGQQRVLGLLVHGDAAFAGLGIVPECLQLSSAPGQTQTALPGLTCLQRIHPASAALNACIRAHLDRR